MTKLQVSCGYVNCESLDHVIERLDNVNMTPSHRQLVTTGAMVQATHPNLPPVPPFTPHIGSNLQNFSPPNTVIVPYYLPIHQFYNYFLPSLNVPGEMRNPEGAPDRELLSYGTSSEELSFGSTTLPSLVFSPYDESDQSIPSSSYEKSDRFEELVSSSPRQHEDSEKFGESSPQESDETKKALASSHHEIEESLQRESLTYERQINEHSVSQNVPGNTSEAEVKKVGTGTCLTGMLTPPLFNNDTEFPRLEENKIVRRNVQSKTKFKKLERPSQRSGLQPKTDSNPSESIPCKHNPPKYCPPLYQKSTSSASESSPKNSVDKSQKVVVIDKGNKGILKNKDQITLNKSRSTEPKNSPDQIWPYGDSYYKALRRCQRRKKEQDLCRSQKFEKEEASWSSNQRPFQTKEIENAEMDVPPFASPHVGNPGVPPHPVEDGTFPKQVFPSTNNLFEKASEDEKKRYRYRKFRRKMKERKLRKKRKKNNFFPSPHPKVRSFPHRRRRQRRKVVKLGSKVGKPVASVDPAITITPQTNTNIDKAPSCTGACQTTIPNNTLVDSENVNQEAVKEEKHLQAKAYIAEQAVAVVSPSVKPLETALSSVSEVVSPPTQASATAKAPAIGTASPIILNQRNLGEFLAQNTVPDSSFFIQGSGYQLPIIISVRGAVSQPADPSADSLDPLVVQPVRGYNESNLPSTPASSATEMNTPQTAISLVLQAGTTTGDVIGEVSRQLVKGHVISGLAVKRNRVPRSTVANKEFALTLACHKGHLEMVRFFLEAGADQEHKTDEMHTALMEASMDGHVEVARLLLDSGAQVNMPADSFESPLTLAACGGHVELAMLLLERGANIEEVNDEGYTPLMEASREGHEEMVALLLSQGADINAQTEETQETALTLACCGSFLEVADFLIKAGADIELGASTPPMEASQEGHLELVRYLLEAGANVTATTGTGDTALTYACENGHTDVADLLLQYNAPLEHESEGGRTPLMKASRAGHLCTVTFLISRGSDVNRHTTNNDHTSLSLACAGGHLAVVEVLLQQGADPFHKLKDNSTMLIEAAKGGHTTVVEMLIDYPNSLVVTTSLEGGVVETAPPLVPPTLAELDRVPPPGSDATCIGSVTAVTPVRFKSALRKNQAVGGGGGGPNVPPPGKAGTAPPSGPALPDAGYDFLEGSGFVLEGLEEKGLDAKSYIQTMLRRTEGSSKEEQAIQKEQILAELQRVEKELQEKAQAQLMLSNQPGQAESKGGQMLPAKREAAAGEEVTSTPPELVGTTINNTEVIQNMANLSIAGGRSLANIPPSERPKAKPSRKIDGKGAKKSQLQAALQQHSQQLQQLNQQLQQQVLQQRQLKQQNQATLPALQQNAIANQQQLAALQQNVAHLQHLEQTILTQQTTDHNQQQQQRVQQILQQKQQLQQQIKQFQQQVEQQLAYTQHAGPVPPLAVTTPPPLPAGPPPAPPTTTSKKKLISSSAVTTCATTITTTKDGWEEGGGEEFDNSLDLQQGYVDLTQETVQTTDLNFLMTSEGLQGFMAAGPGGVPAGIDPSLLTSAAFELVQASQALQAVQAVQPLLHSESPPLMTPLTQDPGLLSSMDPAQIAAAVQHCPIPLDSALQVATSGGVQLQYTSPVPGGVPGLVGGVSGAGCVAGLPLLTDCSQHTQPISGFGHQLLLQPQFTFGGQGLPVLDAGGVAVSGADLSNAAFQHQLQLGGATTDLSQLSFPAAAQQEQDGKNGKKTGGKKTATAAAQQQAVAAAAAAGMTAAGLQTQGGMLEGGYAGHYIPGAGYPSYATPAAPGIPVVDLDSETDSNHDTALTLACAGGHEELVTLLLSRGADIEHRDKKGFTPLILAATAGHDKVVEILLNHGADIEAQSERTKDTPLSLACSGGRYEVVEILLSRGANKEHRNVSDYTPLSLAASGGYTNIIKLLLAHGAEINSRTGSKLGISPLMLAAMNGHTAAVKLLLDMGSDINAQIETNRNTALTLACFQGRHEVVSLLLDRKANVEHRAKTGLTPLMEAASGGYTEVGRVLLDKGADVNASPVPSSRDTALTIAADKGHYRFVELLLSRGAQVDVRNKKGNSSLWLAANGGHLDVVQLLYSAGADIDSQDNRRVSCLMAAFRKGHSKVVKWLVKHVTQFPSDTELTRFIATISDKDLLKKTHQCLEIIRVAKERQASEANKAASILLEELEQEKTREESKKAAAARKREKKKRKKAEKKGVRIEDDEEENEDEEIKENGDATTEDEKEKSPEIITEGDSGIDANSMGSGGSNEQQETENKEGKKKKNKKKKDKDREKERNEKNEEQQKSEEKENNNNAMNNANKEKSPGEDDDRPDSRGDRSSQPRVPCTIEGHAAGIPQQETTPAVKQEPFIEPVGRKARNRMARASEQSPGENKVAAVSPKKPGVAGKTTVPDAGWKEVVRKSKKVSVPSNAISRVIGRGGSNINAIRELSGAHIEVEKQSKGQGDRTILIKGSAEATRLANQWITAIIASPEKDLAEIVGRQQFKQLCMANLTKSTAVVVTSKTIVKTLVTSTTGTTSAMKDGKSKKQVMAAISTATKMTLAYTGPVMTSKTKPVTSTSFAAIAAHATSNPGDLLGMIPTGPPPGSAIKPPSQQKPVVPQPMGKSGKKDEAQPLMQSTVTSTASNDKDYSPFKMFNKIPGNIVGSFGGWGNDKADEYNMNKNFGMTVSTTASSTVVEQPSVDACPSKAPGYRSSMPAAGSPGSTGSVSSVSSWSGSNTTQSASQPSAAPGYKKPAEPTGQLYPQQERCNSAPGTPVSPLVPSPIGPPSGSSNSKPTNSSPGSEPDWFRAPGHGGPSLRSMTPDGDLDRGWGASRHDESDSARRPGTGSYGHSSPAKAPGAPIPELFSNRTINKPMDPTTGLATENLLNAAAQLSSLSANYDLMNAGPVSSASVSLAPGIPIQDLPTSYTAFGSNPGFGGHRMPPGPRFTTPISTCGTTPIFSQQQNMTVTSSLAKGLNPNAPDFNRGGVYGGTVRGSIGSRAPGMAGSAPGPKYGSQFPTYATNNFGNNFQNILTNQGINAYLNQLGVGGGSSGLGPSAPVLDVGSLNSGLTELSLAGRSLSEMADMLGNDGGPTYPSYMGDMEPKFSRPIGAERTRTMGPSIPPLPPTNMSTNRKVDPFAVWEMPPSYNDGTGAGPNLTSNIGLGSSNLPNLSNHLPNLSSNTFASNNSVSNNDPAFSLPPSLSGQTLQSALDNLSKTGLQGMGAFNGSGPIMDPGSIGGDTPSSGFGLSPAITPNKQPDYSQWGTGSTSGSAPGSANKNMPFVDRGDPNAVRRNMNHMWTKNWDE